MLTIVLAAAMTLTPHQGTMAQGPLSCAVLGNPVADGGPAVDYKGVRYAFCCSMCPAGFQKDPEKQLGVDRGNGKTIGVSLFDPVSDSRITADSAKASTDYQGVRYLFASADEQKTFAATPDKYTKTPDKEALFCPVEKQKLSGYAAAGSYRDYEGVRYYFCCAQCPVDFMKKPADYIKNAAAYVTTPKAIVPAEEKKADADTSFQASTFNCKHCGNQVSINSPDDGNSVCSACHCGKTLNQCKG